MTLRSPLGRVRGLGSAKDGVHHWWAQRLTALALVPLTIWFVVSLICMVGADRIEVIAWLSSPFSRSHSEADRGPVLPGGRPYL